MSFSQLKSVDSFHLVLLFFFCCWSWQFAQWELVKTFNLVRFVWTGVWCECFSMPILCSITGFARNDFVTRGSDARVRIYVFVGRCVGCWSCQPYAMPWIKLTTLFCGGTFYHTCFIVGGISSWFSIITLIGSSTHRVLLSMRRHPHTTIYLWFILRQARARNYRFLFLFPLRRHRKRTNTLKKRRKRNWKRNEGERRWSRRNAWIFNGFAVVDAFKNCSRQIFWKY